MVLGKWLITHVRLNIPRLKRKLTYSICMILYLAYVLHYAQWANRYQKKCGAIEHRSHSSRAHYTPPSQSIEGSSKITNLQLFLTLLKTVEESRDMKMREAMMRPITRRTMFQISFFNTDPLPRVMAMCTGLLGLPSFSSTITRYHSQYTCNLAATWFSQKKPPSIYNLVLGRLQFESVHADFDPKVIWRHRGHNCHSK